MTDAVLIEDLKLLARWEPTKRRRIEICERAAKRLKELSEGEDDSADRLIAWMLDG